MKTIALRLLVLFFVASFPFSTALSQQKGQLKEKKKEIISPLAPGAAARAGDSTLKGGFPKRILGEIEIAIEKGDGEALSHYLGSQVYISLKGSDWGYYSANQALYILRNFFLTHKPVSFAFSTYGEVEANPFATGRGYFSTRGVRESLQIYVSLAQREGRWVIAEFNAY